VTPGWYRTPASRRRMHAGNQEIVEWVAYVNPLQSCSQQPTGSQASSAFASDAGACTGKISCVALAGPCTSFSGVV